MPYQGTLKWDRAMLTPEGTSGVEVSLEVHMFLMIHNQPSLKKLAAELIHINKGGTGHFVKLMALSFLLRTKPLLGTLCCNRDSMEIYTVPENIHFSQLL